MRRNAFGNQLDSFETDLDVDLDGPPVHAAFIRAPIVEAVGPAAEAVATLPDGRVVAVRQGNLLGTSFHPELTGETRFHQLLLSLLSHDSRKNPRQQERGGPFFLLNRLVPALVLGSSCCRARLGG